MRLIDEAGKFYKLGSVQLAAVAGVLAAYFAANPNEAEKLLNLLPEGPLRIVASILIGLFVFSAATTSRLVSLKKKDEEDAG